MSDVIEIAKSDPDHSNYPSWAETIDTDGKTIRPDIRCRCGEHTNILNHHIHTDGRITASYFHQNGCGWHVFLKLKDWTGHEFKPGQQFPT